METRCRARDDEGRTPYGTRPSCSPWELLRDGDPEHLALAGRHGLVGHVNGTVGADGHAERGDQRAGSEKFGAGADATGATATANAAVHPRSRRERPATGTNSAQHDLPTTAPPIRRQERTGEKL